MSGASGFNLTCRYSLGRTREQRWRSAPFTYLWSAGAGRVKRAVSSWLMDIRESDKDFYDFCYTYESER